VIPDDIRALAQELADRQTGPMTIALSELAELLRAAKPVRSIPAQRLITGSAALGTTTGVPIVQVSGRGRADVKRIRIAYLGADATADAVRVASSREALQAPTAGSCFVLNTLNPLLELEVNMADVFVGTVLASAGTVTWAVEEYDPS
jgi:hypothetical protein